MPIVPRSLSPTALETGIQCPARFVAENVDRNRPESGTPALLGTVVHAALQRYVDQTVIQGAFPQEMRFLETLFEIEYDRVFAIRDVWYDDGLEMLQTWWKRTDFTGVRVLSLEQKRSFPVPLPDGTQVPFNYIIDRLDEVEGPDGARVLRVVDYKTVRRAISPEQLRSKLQARAYGLAMQIEYKDAGFDKIQVVFDLLRHTTVGIEMTREDNKASYRAIRRYVEELYHQDETNPDERLNVNCHYCIRKATCKALSSNVAAGGIGALATTDELVRARADVSVQIKGLTALQDELDERLLTIMEQEGIPELKSADGRTASLKAGGRRYVDSGMVARVLPPELALKYANFRVGDVDRINKDPEVSEEVKKEVRKLVSYRHDEAGIVSGGWEEEL